MAYDTIGGYTSGVWLVTKDGYHGVVATRAHLPKEGTGYHYFWLGDTVQKANQRLDSGVTALFSDSANVAGGNVNVAQAFSHGWTPINWSSSGASGGTTLPELLLYGTSGIIAAKTLGGAGAAGGAASKLKNAGSKLPAAAKKALTALSLAALFGNIGLWKGIGLVIAGAGLVLIGILNLAGVDPGGIGKTATRVARP